LVEVQGAVLVDTLVLEIAALAGLVLVVLAVLVEEVAGVV
jgi:hypothetical protein